MRDLYQAVVVAVAGEGVHVPIGVVLESRGVMRSRFVRAWVPISRALPVADVEHVRRAAKAIERRAREAGRGDVVQRVVLEAIDRDPTLQVSSVLGGSTEDPARTLDELFERCVTGTAVESGR